jgi:cytochrome c-type biogenesis protein CcmH
MLENMNHLCLFRTLFLFFTLLFYAIAYASPIEIYPFNSPADEKKFQTLLKELRCLVCQNQNIAESNAPLASDLRLLIYKSIKQGKSEKQIKEYLTSRYGPFILLQPAFSPLTYVLWLGPFLLSMLVIIKIRHYFRGQGYIKLS